MSCRSTRNTCRGFTLMEVAVSLVASAVLLVGLNSAVLVALKASDVSLTPASAALAANACLTEMEAELSYALSIVDKRQNAITVVVPDRDDANAYPELIRYAWAGTRGDPLLRQYNGGMVATVAENVADFNISYFKNSGTYEYLGVQLQIGRDARAFVETAIPLLNRP
jgi:prepilin-type N-terminal cleavage/methylation domain-containing protein